MHKDNCHFYPTTFQHDHHSHQCGCVKCYITSVITLPIFEFVWLYDCYSQSFNVFNLDKNTLHSFNLYILSNPRSPPFSL